MKMTRLFGKRMRKSKKKKAVPVLPESHLPRYKVVGPTKGLTHKPTFIARVTIGDITAYGTGQRKKLAKRNALDTAFKCGLTRLRCSRLYTSFENRPLSSKYGEVIDLTGESGRPKEVIIVGDNEICNVKTNVPKPKDTKEIIEIMDGDDDISESDANLPKPAAGSAKEIVEIEDGGFGTLKAKKFIAEKSVVVKDYVFDHNFAYNKIIEVGEDDYSDLSFGFSRPADAESAVIDLTDNEIIDLTDNDN